MANVQFGPGVAVFIPSTNNAALLANPTPQTPAVLQDLSIDFKATEKELMGRGQWAVDTTRGSIKASGKAKIGSTDPFLMNQLYFGMPQTVGSVRPITDEPHTPGASVVVTSATGFAEDRGVKDATTGNIFIKVASAPAIGQYSVSTTSGTYTFNASETATGVLISYSYQSSVLGTTTLLSSQPQGYCPEFELVAYSQYRGRLFSLTLFRCKMTDLSLATKQSDYQMSDFTYSVSANDAGNIGVIHADQ